MRGDLRQMRHAQHLVFFGRSRHFLAHDAADFSADIGVHLVEHEHRDVVEIRENGLQRQHHAREFAAGGYAGQRQGRLAGIR